MEVEAKGGRIRLFVFGPRQHRAVFESDDLKIVLEHQSACERRVLSEGFTLNEFTSDRRRWPR